MNEIEKVGSLIRGFGLEYSEYEPNVCGFVDEKNDIDVRHLSSDVEKWRVDANSQRARQKAKKLILFLKENNINILNDLN